MSDKPDKKWSFNPFGLVMGVAVGTAIAVALDNFAIGIGVGAGVAVVFGSISPTSDRNDSAD